jgi:hypothetical protein
MDLSAIREICQNFYVADDKWFRDFRPLGHRNPGELNFLEGPTMFLKIKGNRSDILDGPTILMKTSNLFLKATMFMKRNILSWK